MWHQATLVAVDPLHQIDEWPPANASAGWITSTGRSGRIGAHDQPFAIASITKALFSLGILIALEEGTIHLDQPAGPSGASVRHLLAHASGLGFDTQSTQAPVGARRIYSNAGFDVLAATLAEAARMPATQYWTQAVGEPLGLADTTIPGSVAYSGISTLDDLLLFCSELLAPTLLSPATMLAARTSQFPELVGVVPGFGRYDPNPWGLGFEVRGTKHPHWTGSTNSPSTFGHFGASGTMLWVDPDQDLALVYLSDLDFGPWSKEQWPRFSDEMLRSFT